MSDFAPPRDGLVLGYGPMLPLVAAGAGAWLLPPPWPYAAVQLAIVWAALLLAFIGGVRRGFGFARASASRIAEIAAAAAYLLIALLALLVTEATLSLAVLIAGYLLAALLDWRAARRGNAPAWFARLRPPQLLLGAAGLAGCLARLSS